MDLSFLRPKKHDIIIAAVVLAAAVCAFAFVLLNRHPGAEVVVTAAADGAERVILRLPLDRDHEEDIVTEYGTNHLVIRDGRAYITEADCPDHICVNAWSDGIAHSGEMIICLPHRLYVSIEGEVPEAEDGNGRSDADPDPSGSPDAVVNKKAVRSGS